jgi:hypothetical protein
MTTTITETAATASNGQLISQRTPAKPFYFNTSAHLLRITTKKATTLVELLDALRTCPDDSIFQHTFRTLQEHHFIRERLFERLRALGAGGLQ